MSVFKLNTELNRIEDNQGENCRRVDSPTFIFGDSKVGYLKRESGTSLQQLQFIYRGGATSSDNSLKRILFSKIKHVRQPTVLVWFGTCELTVKTGKYINIVDEVQTKIEQIIESYKKLKLEVATINRQSRVLFIECPYISAQQWNHYKGDIDESRYQEVDYELEQAVNSLNDKINEINQSATPRLSQDLIASTKKKDQRTKYKVNYKLLVDGVHPSGVLSKLWIRKLCVLVNRVAVEARD